MVFVGERDEGRTSLVVLRFVEQDVISIDNNSLAVVDEVKPLSVLQNKFGRALPIPVGISFVVDPVSNMYGRKIGVNPLFKSLADGEIGLGGSKGFPAMPTPKVSNQL